MKIMSSLAETTWKRLLMAITVNRRDHPTSLERSRRTKISSFSNQGTRDLLVTNKTKAIIILESKLSLD